MIDIELFPIKILLTSTFNSIFVRHESDAGSAVNDGHMSMMGMNFSLGVWTFIFVFVALGMVLMLFIGSLVFQHAVRNNISYPLIWAILVVTMPMIGIPLYLLVLSQTSTLTKQVTTVPSRVGDKDTITSYEQLNVPSKSLSQPVRGNVEPTVRYCPRCGELVGKDDLFCSNCGQKLT